MTSTSSPRWNRPVFVASMGRSGSTLLQRLLNVHPDLTIWGEHAGFLSKLVDARVALHNSEANLVEGFANRHTVIGELSDKTVFRPWVSPFQPTDFDARLRELILSLFTEGLPPDVRWGFKEIRYTERELRVLLELFPDAHLVVLARDIAGYTMSRFFAFGFTDFDLETDEGIKRASDRLSGVMRGWINRYEGLLTLVDEFPQQAFTVAYSDLVVGSSRPQELFGELGEAPASDEAIDAVLGAVAGSSYKHNSAARSNRTKLQALIYDVEVDLDAVDRISSVFGVAALNGRT